MKHILTGFFVIVFVIFLVVGASNNSAEKYEKLGYETGYQKGYNQVFNEYAPRLSKQVISHENEIKKIDELYALKIRQAEEEGLYKGKQDQLKEVNNLIEQKSENAKKSKNWSSVLFEVK